MASEGEVHWVSVFVDVPPQDVPAATEFWTKVTGTVTGPPVGHDAEFIPLQQAADEASLWLQRTRSGPVSCHVDLYVDDVGRTAEAAAVLGARRQAELEDLGVIVMSSPGGMPFCLVRHRGQSVRMAPVGEAGSRSVLDQVCLDIPPGRFDEECRFWAALTGWQLEDQDAMDEFTRLVRPPAIPYAFLLQRLDEPQPGRDGVSAHLDLACDDRDAESRRHEGLGASVVRRTEGWTVMRDPVGLTYCNTGKPPGAV